MKIAFLASAASIHSRRWVNALAARGHTVVMYSQHEPDGPIDSSVRLIRLPWHGNHGYFLNAAYVRRHLAGCRMDILNAHYASGYGTTAKYVGYAPTLLSVWGADVFDFPYESKLKGSLIRRNIRAANRVASTSEFMARQFRRLVPDVSTIFITPFGVDCSQFRPAPKPRTPEIVIGTVKTLHAKYGIDTLIEGFARLINNRELVSSELADSLRLVIVGGGPERASLEKLARSLGLGETRASFIGPVLHSDVPQWLNKLDIYVAASRLDSESFGVAAVEASACGVPVIVSDAGGLPEVVEHERSGLIVARNDPDRLAVAMAMLTRSSEMRARLAAHGRQLVLDRYEWSRCVDMMEAAYAETIAEHRSRDRQS